MEFKNSFLSWLFKPRPEKAETEEAPQPVEQAAAPPERAPRHTLQLPETHNLYKLWSLYSEQTGWQPPPELSLEGETDPIMPDGEAKQELLRLQRAVDSTTKSRFEQAQKRMPAEEGEEPAPPDLDAQAVVVSAQNNLTAWLLIYPPVGQGQEVDRAELDRALEEKQVCYGLNEDLLSGLSQNPERYFHLFPVARGVPAEHGTDGRVVDLFPRTEERTLTVGEDNRVDYTNLNFIHNVEAGGVICRIIPPAEGIPGRTVQDEEIPAKNGKPATVPKGRGTDLNEDESALIATAAGHVEFSGRSFQVKPVLDIAGNVDFSVGNINYVGDVCIHGDVCSGFTVRAMGSITIEGVVEACTLEAGRDLVVARGIQGDNQAVIRAQRNIFAKYLENCCVYTKMNLETDCIINCDVYCDGAVKVRSGHQSIIGGKTRAAHEVSAGIVGSRVGNRTDIVLGGQPCDDFDYDMLTRDIQQLEETMKQTEQEPDSPSKLGRMGKLRVQLAVNRSKLDALVKDREQQALEPRDPGLRRMVCDTVFPGTVLDIGGVVYRFDREVYPCSATLKGGEIQLI